MASSKRSKELFDPIRQEWVVATPEEHVRQRVIQRLLQLGFPKTHIAVEKELRSLPHINRAPDRRVDVICFATGTLDPLLLIECKEGRAKEDALSQLKGYNHHVNAPYLAVVDEEHTHFYAGSQSFDFIPKYAELICQLQK